MDSGNANVSFLGAGGVNQKQRFHVELTPGQTNIVSFKKLKREAGEVVSDDSSSDENEAERYIFVKLPRKRRSGVHAIREKVQHNRVRMGDSEPSNDQTKRKELIDHVGNEDDVQLDKKYKRKGKEIIKTAQFTKSSMSKNVEQQGFTSIKQSRKGRNEVPSHNLTNKGHAQRTESVQLTGAPKIGDGNLDRSILQLKMMVEHLNERENYASSTAKTLLINVQGADASWLDLEKNMSPELKEMLAKIARSTQLIKGKISEELIGCLMVILGNYLKRKTLKKILREMILEDLYASKSKCNSFKKIKKDLIKMITLQAPSLKVKISTSTMGDQLEDKLFDVYDTFSQGLDEDIRPSLVRRLFAKLAELWPKDTMDMHQIREAICRARERKMALNSDKL